MYKLILMLLGASAFACSKQIVVSVAKIAVTTSGESHSEMAEFIAPYSDSLSKSMEEVIAHSNVDLIKERPNSNLMRWAANAVFTHETKNIRLSKPTFCLLNTGGLRSIIGKGPVKVGDIFKLMPFDNTVVWVEFDISLLAEIERYLQNSGGEPISNATFDGKALRLNQTIKSESFLLITSDYLYHGGDSMTFMEKGKIVKTEGKKIRDIFLEEAKLQSELEYFCE